MIQKLSSIKFAFYNLIFMIFLLGTGIYLSRLYKSDFKMMNEIHIFDWFSGTWSETPVLVIWFVLLCCSAALLFINALFCSFTKQINIALKYNALQNWLFFILHCLFIIVLTCHGLTLVIGSKESNVILYPDESIIFNNQYKIEVAEVVFKDDINILKADKDEQRTLMTRKNMNRKHNFAKISLFKDSKYLTESQLLETKKVIMLAPLRYCSLQVTLTGFIIKDGKIGVNLIITKNILNTFFFTIYALMILVLGLYIFLSFRNPK